MKPHRRFMVSITISVALTSLVIVTTVDALADGMGHNGLSSIALFNNAITTNPTALGILISKPLCDTTFQNNEYLYRQLSDPFARAVMQDLVACALRPAENVFEWKGEMGLCSSDAQGGPLGNWGSQPPSVQCLQLVSACLLARVNGLHRRVPISFHGVLNDGVRDVFPMRQTVSMETRYRESEGSDADGLIEGTLIDGLPDGNHCPQGHDCSWSSTYTGVCAEGQSVTIEFPGRAACDQKSIRVCKGVYGCGNNDFNVDPPSALEYSGFVVSQSKQTNSCNIEFKCPHQAAYGVMIKPPAQLMTVQSSTYPAFETDVYTFREGAFFGNLFDPTALTRTREVIIKGNTLILSEITKESIQLLMAELPSPWRSGVASSYTIKSTCQSTYPTCGCDIMNSSPYLHAYACYGLDDADDIHLNEENGVENTNDRICANPSSKNGCFLFRLKRCRDINNPNNLDTNLCKWDNGKHAYTGCLGDGKEYPPITTYLDDPCSLLDQRQCAVLRAHRREARRPPSVGSHVVSPAMTPASPATPTPHR